MPPNPHWDTKDGRIWNEYRKSWDRPADYVPTKMGPKTKPDAIKLMRRMIRIRQNIVADLYDEVGVEYDWDTDLRYKWLPGNGKVYVRNPKDGKLYP